jgi:hypothetical protein
VGESKRERERVKERERDESGKEDTVLVNGNGKVDRICPSSVPKCCYQTVTSCHTLPKQCIAYMVSITLSFSPFLWGTLRHMHSITPPTHSHS